jgi:hypothetical protein
MYGTFLIEQASYKCSKFYSKKSGERQKLTIILLIDEIQLAVLSEKKKAMVCTCWADVRSFTP